MLLPQSAFAGCDGDAIYDFVGWNPTTKEILVRALVFASESEEPATDKDVNNASIVASKMNFPYRFREVSKFNFSDKLVGKDLIAKTEKVIGELRKSGFESTKFKIVKPTGKVTAIPKEPAACHSEGRCGDLEFEDPLKNGGKFIVRKAPVPGDAHDVEHILIYRDAQKKETVLQKSLFDKKGYSRIGIAFPQELVFWDSYVTGMSAWCHQPSPWTAKLTARRSP
jgi:hypothetical protein